MQFCSLDGRFQNVNNSYQYLIDWDAKCLSKFQKKVKDLLRPFWASETVFEEYPMAGSKLRFDFYNLDRQIILEVSGHQHYTYSNFFHTKKSDFLKQIMRDQRKAQFCELNHINFIEIYEYENPELSNQFLRKMKLI